MKAGLDRLNAHMDHPDRSMMVSTDQKEDEKVRRMAEDLNFCRNTLGFPLHVLSKYHVQLERMHTAMHCMSQISSFLQSLGHGDSDDNDDGGGGGVGGGGGGGKQMTSSQLRDGYQKAAHILKTAKEIGLVVPELGVIDTYLQQLSERAEMLLQLQTAMVDAEGSALALVLQGLYRLCSRYPNFNPPEIAEAEQLLVVVEQEQSITTELLSTIEGSHADLLLLRIDRSVVRTNDTGTPDDDALSSLVQASMASLTSKLDALCRERLPLQCNSFQSKSHKVCSAVLIIYIMAD